MITRSTITMVICLCNLQVLRGEYGKALVKKIWNRGYSIDGLQIRGIDTSIVNPQDVIYFPQLSKNLKYIEVINSTIAVLPRKSFNAHLWGITLSNVGLKAIQSGAFEGVDRIEELDLSYNSISTISDGIFGNFKELMFLNLSNNKIKSISTNAFKGSNLTELHLENNEISNLADELFDYQKTSLKILNISFNFLNEVSRTFTGMITLKELYLQCNDISRIAPTGFRGLESLRYLDISHNKVESFQCGLFGNSPLQYLDFSYNNMINSPVLNISYLTRLKRIYFRNNILPIDMEIVNFPLLEETDLDGLYRPCSELEKITKELMDKNIAIKRGEYLDDYNILGYKCDIRNITFLQTESTTERELSGRYNTTESIIEQSTRSVTDPIENIKKLPLGHSENDVNNIKPF